MIRGILYTELWDLFEQNPDTLRWNLSVEFWDCARRGVRHPSARVRSRSTANTAPTSASRDKVVAAGKPFYVGKLPKADLLRGVPIGLPNTAKSPRTVRRMAAEGMQISWQ